MTFLVSACERARAVSVVPTSGVEGDLSSVTAPIDPAVVRALVGTGVAEALTQTAVAASAGGADGGATSTATEVPDIYAPGMRWTGELPFNNLPLKYGTPSWEEIVLRLIEDYARKGELQGANSLLTSLTNPLESNKDRFDPEPETEPGLGHTDKDMANYQDLAAIIANLDNMAVTQLGYYNPETGLWTGGIYGWTHDKDAITFFAAMGLAAAREPGRFINLGQFMTLEQVMADAGLVERIVGLQRQIYDQTQDAFLGLSQAEVDRRAAGGDASAQIPDPAQRDDQVQTCDDYLAGADSRVDQPQENRLVQHVSGGRDVFVEADVDGEGLLVALSFDMQTGLWDADAHTDRGYEGEVEGQENSASGEQERPCGEEVPSLPQPQLPSPEVSPVAPPPVAPILPPPLPPTAAVPPPAAPPPPGGQQSTSTLVPPTEVRATATPPPSEASPQGPEATATVGEPAGQEPTQGATPADTPAPNQQSPETQVAPPTDAPAVSTSGFGD